MNYLIGIDLGTSSVKAILMDREGNILSQAQKSYQIDVPEIGYAEQSPELWWSSTKNVLKKILEQNIDPSRIGGIGFSGQMHGLVMVGKRGESVRPAIIWSDQRSKSQVERINRLIQEEKAAGKMLNSVSTGFAVASLLWVKENEPESYGKTDKVLLPKDYIRFRLTGKLAVEATDASSTLAFNVAERKWAECLIDTLDLKKELFPPCFEPFDIAGEVTERAARETGLPEGIPVVFGGGDQFMHAVGNGLVYPGMVSSNIGTGGQIAAMTDQPLYDSKLRTNTFCHVKPNTWNIQGSSLNSGLSLEWLKTNILKEKDFGTMEAMAAGVPPGSDGLIFLPYLTGERTPHLNPNAKGIFFGLAFGHRSEHLVRAVMEGVAFSLKDSLEIMESLGIKADKVMASGGGAKSRLWLQIQADVYNKPIYTTKTREEASLGAAITAGVGIGLYPSVEEACEKVIHTHAEIIEPIKKNSSLYAERYEVFKELYRRNKDLFLL
ncbi:xylulokinase [Heyndrickxia acidicola]|uniref:Xylulose kinase n=1 Tax=Heyndrickxia acidicola TaxID=209389 RepID=A0ABU6MHA5_9BACI|nr:xylulokinase [Heyndrickxia acidicola]MED1203038.1 xylulokinase [Heyndrickxia acidicola]